MSQVSKLEQLSITLKGKLGPLCEGEKVVNKKARQLVELISELDDKIKWHPLTALLVVISHPCIKWGKSQDLVDQACLATWEEIDTLSYTTDAVGFSHADGFSHAEYSCSPANVAGCWSETLNEYFKRYKGIAGPHVELSTDFPALGFAGNTDIRRFMTFMKRLANLKPAQLCKLRWLAQVLQYGCRCLDD